MSETHPNVSIEVPGYSGRGVAVNAGATIRVTNLHGTQIGDMFALLQSDPTEYLDTARTRLMTGRLFPKVQQQLYSNRQRSLFTFLTDTSPGVHDSLYATCDVNLHEMIGAGKDHPNCHDNYLSAVKSLGLDIDFVPGPANLFQNTPVAADGTLSAGPSPARAGDYVEFRAERDVYFVLTACSVDIGSDINGGESKPLQIDVFA